MNDEEEAYDERDSSAVWTLLLAGNIGLVWTLILYAYITELLFIVQRFFFSRVGGRSGSVDDLDPL